MTFSTSTRRSERLPSWLRRKIPLLHESARIERAVGRRGLHTICREGLCPNRAECYARGKVTFMMMGDVCTRGCLFCSVATGRPEAPDPGEPARIAEAAGELGLDHVIVTSVTRDDLPDGGASMFASVIGELRRLADAPVVEVLVPDFNGSGDSLDTVLDAGPDIFSHNIETVRRLYPEVRSGAVYDSSLGILAGASEREVLTKSSFMLGLGETMEEVEETMADLRSAGVDYTAIGQYLRPGTDQVPVREYVEPERFAEIEKMGSSMGFLEVTAGPLVRSSYQENSVGIRRAAPAEKKRGRKEEDVQ